MKFNFEKNIKKPVEKTLIGSAIVFSALKPMESKGQEQLDSAKDTKEKSINIDDSKKEEIKDKVLEKEIDTLRVQKIIELKYSIKSLKDDIEINSNYQEFFNQKKESYKFDKKEYEKELNRLDSIKKEILNLPEKEVSLLTEYLCSSWRDLKVPIENQKNNGEYEKFFGLYVSYYTKNIEEKFNKDEKIINFYYELPEFIREEDVFEKIVDSMGHEKNPKEKFSKGIDKIIEFVHSHHACFKSEEEIEKVIKDKWDHRPSVDSFNAKINEKQKEIDIINENLKLDNITNFISTSKDWILNNISSDSYLQKLIYGEKLSFEDAKKIQFERFERVKKMPIGIDPNYLSYSEFKSTEQGALNDSVSINAYDISKYNLQALHELEHANTRGIAEISERAKELYQSSLINNDSLEKTMGDGDYWKNPSEMDARKKVLEYDMEKFGIKKYGEIMTHEHYVKLQELMKEGKLDHNSVQILSITTEEGLIKVLNEVAFNEDFTKDENIG